MITLQIIIPDFLARQAADAAAKEPTSVDHILSPALSSQLSAWQVRVWRPHACVQRSAV